MEIVSVSISDVQIGDHHTYIEHMPFIRNAIETSITDLISSSNNLPDFEGGYNTWKEAWDNGKAGAFDIPVKQAVDYITQVANG